MKGRIELKAATLPVWVAGLDDTPLGALSVAASPKGLVRLAFMPAGDLASQLGAPVMTGNPAPQFLADALVQLGEYLSGKCRMFDIPVDWSWHSAFHQTIRRATIAIPYGEVRTYGELAWQAGKPSAARAVGGAMNRNPLPIIIPCHRVIDSQRRLTGYGAPGGLATKAWLLRLEGHTIVNDKLV